jgi:hypothetical protein
VLRLQSYRGCLYASPPPHTWEHCDESQLHGDRYACTIPGACILHHVLVFYPGKPLLHFQHLFLRLRAPHIKARQA